MHISQRIKYIIDEFGLNMNSFSKEIGLTNNVTIGKIIGERRNPSYEVTMKILNKYPQINTEWFIKGTGDVFLTEWSDNAVNDPGIHYGMSKTEKKLASIEAKMLTVMIELKELKEML